MSPGQAFLLSLFLLYLADCFLLVPRRGFGFLSIFGGRRWGLRLPSAALGNDRAGLVLAMPLPPLGRAFVAGLWPISLTPDGFTGVVMSCVNPGLRPALASSFIRWEEVNEVGWESRKLLVNGVVFLRLASPQIAREYAVLMSRLVKLEKSERAAVIRQWCREQLSARRVRRRVRVFESATAGLQQSCNLLFIVAFILIPVTFMKFRLGLPFLVSVFVVVMLVLLIGIEFCCLHRGFYPEQRDERFQLWMLVGVMPQCSMRAVDELSKSFLVCAHPLAVAEVFLKETAFRRFRDAVIRDLEFPVPPTLNGSGSELALVAARRFREEFERPAVMEMAFKRVADPVQRLPEPEALETVSVKFCQRCLMPYEVAAQGCIDCGGVPLAGLEV